jgi:CubicO group peptidase (beta-lactamase class C family)
VDQLFAPFTWPDMPGTAVMVIRDGQVVFQGGYGLADVENHTLITPQTLFHLGSVGKQFTALGVMTLADQGLLAYDDPVGDHLPVLADLGEEITIRRLLNHTSGIPDYYKDDQLNKALFALSAEPNNADAMQALGGVEKLSYPPGERFEYSNTGYEVLGMLIEVGSGKSYPEFMRKRIFDPLGMVHTFSLPDPQRFEKPYLAHSYQADGKLYDSDPLDNLVGSGSFYSSLEDLFLYDQALYGQTLVSQAGLAEAWTPGVLNDGEQTNYGFAWTIETYRDQPLYWHDGSWLAFHSLYCRMPVQKLSMVILFNRDYELPEFEELFHELADLYRPGE